MKTYQVNIIESVVSYVDVQANSEEDAKEKALEEFGTGAVNHSSTEVRTGDIKIIDNNI